MKPTVEIATSIRYGNYKRFLKKAEVLKHIILKQWDEFCELTDVKTSDKFTIKIRPMKGRTYGRHCSYEDCIEIDPRKTDLKRTLETFCHEMRHVWQEMSGKFEPKIRGAYWNSTFYTVTGSYSNYMNLPWEVDARSVQEDWCECVFGDQIDVYKHSWVEDTNYAKPPSYKTKSVNTKRQIGGLKVGDVVEFNERCASKYIRGVRAKVVGLLRKRVRVELVDGPIGRFEKFIKCPPVILNKVQ